MATVGNLNVNVNARTAKFNKKMKSVRASVARFGRAIGGIAKKLALFGVMAGAVAVVAIVALTKKGLASVDALAKLAQSIGGTVAGLQTLQHMATIGGVSIEKMDKSIAKMVKNVGEVTMGVGTATDAFKELGLDANKLEKMAPEKMFGTIADAINKIPTSAKRGSLAYDIFGKAGQDLLVTMQGGSQAVDDMRQHLEELGVIIGDDQAQMVEKANDAWADIGLVWDGLSKQLAVNFAPLLEKIANKIVAWVKDVGGMGKVAEFIVKAFMYAGALVLDVIKVLKIAWHGFNSAVLFGFGMVVEGVGVAVSAIVNTWNKGMGLMKTASGVFMSAVAKGMGILGDVLLELGFEQAGLYTSMGGMVIDMKGNELIGGGVSEMLATHKSEFGEFLQSIGQNVQEQGVDHAEAILDLMADGWAMGKVPDAFKNMIDSAMGEGFKDLEGDVTIAAPDVKGAAETLQTVLGGFKVEGDVNARRLDQQLDIEKSQLAELKKISGNISTAGTGAPLT
tara:strand:+ start:5551 stop:7074 length:1524 start_codon:yes stop_codon:yes gene_type:complete